MRRHDVLTEVASAVLARPSDRVVRVGIDGIDGAGKSHFGDELADLLAMSGRSIIRATVDSFHHPREIRYRRGRRSAEGFYRDSYDYTSLASVLLGPLSPGGSGRFRRAVFDVNTDTAVRSEEEDASPGAILVFDGVFLHRPELRRYWDVSVFLEVGWDLRGTRDIGDEWAPRYIDGQKLYLAECHPRELATIVIDNEDFAQPRIRR